MLIFILIFFIFIELIFVTIIALQEMNNEIKLKKILRKKRFKENAKFFVYKDEEAIVFKIGEIRDLDLILN